MHGYGSYSGQVSPSKPSQEQSKGILGYSPTSIFDRANNDCTAIFTKDVVSMKDILTDRTLLQGPNKVCVYPSPLSLPPLRLYRVIKVIAILTLKPVGFILVSMSVFMKMRFLTCTFFLPFSLYPTSLPIRFCLQINPSPNPFLTLIAFPGRFSRPYGCPYPNYVHSRFFLEFCVSLSVHFRFSFDRWPSSISQSVRLPGLSCPASTYSFPGFGQSNANEVEIRGFICDNLPVLYIPPSLLMCVASIRLCVVFDRLLVPSFIILAVFFSGVASYKLSPTAPCLFFIVIPKSLSCYSMLMISLSPAKRIGPIVRIVHVPLQKASNNAKSSLLTNIIDTSFTMDQMNDLFSSIGLSLDDLVILSVSQNKRPMFQAVLILGTHHRLSSLQCFQRQDQNRLQGQLTFVDPSLDHNCAVNLTKPCAAQASTSINNDPVTSSSFDNQYYKNLMLHKGL
ncbi:Peroxidase 18-like protein [Drosera capensis]